MSYQRTRLSPDEIARVKEVQQRLTNETGKTCTNAAILTRLVRVGLDALPPHARLADIFSIVKKESKECRTSI